MSKTYWIVFNNKDYKDDPDLVMDMLTDEYLAAREEKGIQWSLSIIVNVR